MVEISISILDHQDLKENKITAHSNLLSLNHLPATHVYVIVIDPNDFAGYYFSISIMSIFN